MKFLILIEDYNLFYTRFLEQNKELFNKFYDQKLNHLLAQKYYQADSLAQALIKLDHQAKVIIPACNPLQLQWAKENNKKLFFKWHLQKPWRSFKSRFLKEYNTFDAIRDEIVLSQIETIKPDVVFVYSSIWLNINTIRKIKRLGAKTILQWSCPITCRWNDLAFNKFDFVVSATKPLVNFFKQKKIKAFYWQQAFDSYTLTNTELADVKPKKDVVFIGNFVLGHDYRFEIIEYLLQKGVKIDVFGSGNDCIPSNSLLSKTIKPPIHGNEMNDLYKTYKIALHIHTQGIKTDGIDWSSFAGAKRIFEITGIGVAMLASYQDNLKELFDKDEIITFKDKEECLQKINHYLFYENELILLAKKGHKKTLSNHTFDNRAIELLALINNN